MNNIELSCNLASFARRIRKAVEELHDLEVEFKVLEAELDCDRAAAIGGPFYLGNPWYALPSTEPPRRDAPEESDEQAGAEFRADAARLDRHFAATSVEFIETARDIVRPFGYGRNGEPV